MIYKIRLHFYLKEQEDVRIFEIELFFRFDGRLKQFDEFFHHQRISKDQCSDFIINNDRGGLFKIIKEGVIILSVHKCV
jgi:hypothetical protein